jgi:hypothetical protein
MTYDVDMTPAAPFNAGTEDLCGEKSLKNLSTPFIEVIYFRKRVK